MGDLTSYTSKDKVKRKVIQDNKNVLYAVDGEEEEFFFRNDKGLKDYEDNLIFSLTDSTYAETKKDIEKFFQKSLDRGTEGLMIKSLNSQYLSGLRTGAMAKLKGSNEDLDLVVLGAEMGQGKRAGYFSSFYVGVLSEDETDEENRFLTIGKVSSGIKELEGTGVTIEELTKILNKYVIEEKKNVTYFYPKVVLQVRYQEIQKSTTYSSGFALRFPRIIMLREDKPVEEINTIDDIENITK